jgi:hypothetical protein
MEAYYADGSGISAVLQAAVSHSASEAIQARAIQAEPVIAITLFVGGGFLCAEGTPSVAAATSPPEGAMRVVGYVTR